MLARERETVNVNVKMKIKEISKVKVKQRVKVKIKEISKMKVKQRVKVKMKRPIMFCDRSCILMQQTNKQTAIPLFHLVALHIFTATTQTSPFSNPKKMYCPSAEGCTERTAMRRLGTCVNEAGFPSPPKCSSMDGETTAKS